MAALLRRHMRHLMRLRHLRHRLDLRSEQGAIALILILSMVVFIGLAALTVDYGRLTQMKAQAQSAADAAALAGVHESLLGGSDPEILAVVREYVALNDDPNDIDTPEAMTLVETVPETEIAPDFVRATVSKEAPLFFAPVFSLISPGSYERGSVRAQALARRVWVTGAGDVNPWGAMTIRPQSMKVRVNGVETPLSFDSGSNEWVGNIEASGSAPEDTADATGSSVDLLIENTSGYTEEFLGVGSILVRSSGAPLIDAYFADPTIEEGGSATLLVKAPSMPDSVKVGGKSVGGGTSIGGGTYQYTVAAPAINDAVETFRVDIGISTGSGGSQAVTSYQNATRLIVRRAAHSLADVRLINAVTGPGGTVSVRVLVEEYVKDRVYPLKVYADSEAGNFNALDFGAITHPDGTEHGIGGGASDYYNWVGNGFAGEVHIGDMIMTLTGNLSAPQTEGELDDRFASCPYTTVSEWRAAGSPGCSRVVIVPVVQRVEKFTGKSKVEVIQLGAFFVEDYDRDKDDLGVMGTFIDYATPGIYSTTPPPGEIDLVTSRLEQPDF